MNLLYLSRRLGATALPREIVRTIKSGQVSESVLEERYRYCGEQKVLEVIPVAKRDLTNIALSPDLRRAALLALEEIPGGREGIVAILPELHGDLLLAALDYLSKTMEPNAATYGETNGRQGIPGIPEGAIAKRSPVDKRLSPR